MATGKDHVEVEVVATLKGSIEASRTKSRRLRFHTIRSLFGWKAWTVPRKELVTKLLAQAIETIVANDLALRALNKPVELIVIPGGTHLLERPLDRLVSQQGNVDWFVFWLKGDEDADPVKADQYVRWREMRQM